MEPIPLDFAPYEELNSKQRENYNAAKLAAVLADYGFACIRLSDDWSGPDLIAIHRDGKVYKIQLKGRFGFWERYRGKDLYIAFREGLTWFAYPHDDLLEKVNPAFRETPSWQKGSYSYPGLSEENRKLLQDYRLTRQ